MQAARGPLENGAQHSTVRVRDFRPTEPFEPQRRSDPHVHFLQPRHRQPDARSSPNAGPHTTSAAVGTNSWTQDTRGWLSASERRELLGPLAAAHLRNVVGRTRLALHLHPGRHAYLAHERLEAPRTVLARRAEEVAERRLPPVLLHHSRRTYRFGLALGVVAGTEVDDELLYAAALLHDELLYAAALLHDTGLLNFSGDADFTLESTRVAREVAKQVGLPHEATPIVLDAITLHHSPRHQLRDVHDVAHPETVVSLATPRPSSAGPRLWSGSSRIG